MRIGNARIDFDGNIIDGIHGQSIVEPKVMNLLQVLAEKPNTVFSREELITAVWGVDFGGDERLSRAISLLRKALGETKGERKYIETISRRGYRLIADVLPNEPTVAPEVSTGDVQPETELKSKTPASEEDKVISVQKPSNPLSVRSLTAALSIAVSTAIALIIFIFLRAPLSPHTLSISNELTAGFAKIHYFGHANAPKKAQGHFKSVLEREPENAAAHAGLSLAYIREYTSAESDPALIKNAKVSALQALKHNEHLALSYIAMAWAAEFEGERPRALQYLEQADSLDENDELILESRFRLLLAERNIEGAESLIEKSISLYPANALFRSNSAQLSFFKRDLVSAETSSRKAVELDPENPWFHSSLAQLLHLQNRTPEAIKAIQNGLETNESAMLYNNLGTYLFFDGNYELAASAFEKTLRLDGNTHNALFWANVGDAYRWVNGKEALADRNFKRALQIWKEGLVKSPKDFDLRTRIALYEAKMKVGPVPKTLLLEIGDADSLTASQYYRSVVTAEIWKERKLALELLSKAVEAGYPLSEIKNDPELSALREDQGYHLIMSE